jgi:hypothetical protein
MPCYKLTLAFLLPNYVSEKLQVMKAQGGEKLNLGGRE